MIFSAILVGGMLNLVLLLMQVKFSKVEIFEKDKKNS